MGRWARDLPLLEQIIHEGLIVSDSIVREEAATDIGFMTSLVWERDTFVWDVRRTERAGWQRRA